MMRTGQAGALRGRRRVAAWLAGPRVRWVARIAAVARRGPVVPAAAAGLPRDWRPAGVGLTDLGLDRLKRAGRPGRIVQLRAGGLRAVLRCGRWTPRRC